MQCHSVRGVPFGPLDGKLAGGPVPRARHVAEDLVELELLLDVVDLAGVEFRHELAGVVDDRHPRSPGPVDLVDQHLRPAVVCVVGYYAPLRQVLLLPVYHLQQLRGLRARGGAHVQDHVVAVDVEVEGRQHRNQLLAGNQPCVKGALKKEVKAIEEPTFLEDLLRGAHLVEHPVGIPFKHLQLRQFLRLQPLFLLFPALLSLLHRHHRLHEVGVLDFAKEGEVVGGRGVDPEDYGQFFLHRLPEKVELCGRQAQLQLVVGPEEGVFGGDRTGRPLSFHLLARGVLGLELLRPLAHCCQYNLLL